VFTALAIPEKAVK